MNDWPTGLMTRETATIWRDLLALEGIDALVLGKSPDKFCLSLPVPMGYLNTRDECAGFQRGYKNGYARGRHDESLQHV